MRRMMRRVGMRVARYSVSREAFFIACQEGDEATVHQALEGYGKAELNARDGDTGESALHCCAYAGCSKVMQRLVDAGIDVNAQDGIGQTPLHIAAFLHHSECVDILVDHGADLGVKNEVGKTPLQLAVQIQLRPNERTAQVVGMAWMAREILNSQNEALNQLYEQQAKDVEQLMNQQRDMQQQLLKRLMQERSGDILPDEELSEGEKALEDDWDRLDGVFTKRQMQKMRVAELHQLCEDRGIPKRGTKAEIVDRLLAYAEEQDCVDFIKEKPVGEGKMYATHEQVDRDMRKKVFLQELDEDWKAAQMARPEGASVVENVDWLSYLAGVEDEEEIPQILKRADSHRSTVARIVFGKKPQKS